jgi:hypothetical protein
MKKIIFILLLIGLTINMFPQNNAYDIGFFKGNYKKIFTEAESYFLYGDYSEALYLYRLIRKEFPDHEGIDYRIGQCLLEIPYNKEESIKYLLRAKSNVIPQCEEVNLKNSCVPVDLHYYLGDAYRINVQLDKAIISYKEFKKLCDPGIHDVKLVEAQIKACNNAKKLMSNPVNIKETNIGKKINDENANIRPVVSGNDSVLVFVSRLKFYDAVYFSRKINGKWSSPKNIIPQLAVDDKTYPSCLSYDGKELFLYRNIEFNGDIYYSKYEQGRWSEIVKLNRNINTKFWESHACISKDGNTLYFTSNREGGYGGLDIYKSSKNEDGEWGEPENLGNTINTDTDEQTPFITTNGNKLYFSSYGHFNMGGHDIFVSELKGSSWSKPKNLGYPINTTDDDLFFLPVDNGNAAYISKYNKSDGAGKEDIYLIKLSTQSAQRTAHNH